MRDSSRSTLPHRSPVAIARLLILRQFPGFANAELGELAMIADNVLEATFASGAVVAAEGARAPAIHLVVEGAIVAGGVVWGPRTLFGALEVISGRAMTAQGVARGPTRTLQLAAADFAELLEDNYGLLSGTRRALARRALEVSLGPPPWREPAERPGERPLGMVDRLIMLRRSLAFAGGQIQALAALAQAGDEQHWPAGAVIQRAGEPSESSLTIIDGAARARRPDGSTDVLLSGHSLGGLELLAEMPLTRSVEAVTAVRTLRIPGGALFDVLEDHTDFALAMIATFAGALLDSGEPAVFGAPPDDDAISGARRALN